MAELLTSVESAIHHPSSVAIIDGQERPADAQLRIARGLRSEPPTDLFVIAASTTGRGTQASQLVGAVIENELRRSPNKVGRYLRRALDAAHLRLQEKAERSPNLDWTASVACVLISGNDLIFAGVGQTAAFLLRHGQLELIEDDDANGRPWLDSRLGAGDEPQVNMCWGQLEPGDRVLIVVGHLPPHLSGARLRYQLQSSPDAIIQELRSSATPEDCLAALAFAWEPVAQPRPKPAGDETTDGPMPLPIAAFEEPDESVVYGVAVGDGRASQRRVPDRAPRPRAQVASASVGGPWRPAGVAGGRNRPAVEPPRRGGVRRAAARPAPVDSGGTGSLPRLGLLAARKLLREFLPDNQAGLGPSFGQATRRTGTAAHQGVGALGRGWLIGGVAGLIFLVVIGFLAVRLGFNRQDPREEFAGYLGKAEAARSAAVAAPDRESARKQLTLAGDSIKSALTILPNDAQAVALQTEIQKDFKRLNGVVALSQVSPLADLTALAGTATKATGILYQNGRAYVVDTGSGKVFRMVVVSSPEGLKVEEDPTILFQQDDQISDVKLGSPISILWATADNGRPSNNLLVMDAFRNLYQYNSVTERLKVPVRG
ncbi:MAG TPA: hypothetical protein VHL09_16560, partial [Dehalococcoidia bacterium]|nr:hypothetical protein [Dehalococcoidia bacterium]